MGTVLTNAGKALVANRLLGAGTEPKYLAWGTGAGDAAATDTTLFAEAPEARVAGTSSRVTGAVENDTYQVTGRITASAARTITNAGLFDQLALGGNLYVHASFAAIPLAAAGDFLDFVWKVQHI